MRRAEYRASALVARFRNECKEDSTLNLGKGDLICEFVANKKGSWGSVKKRHFEVFYDRLFSIENPDKPPRLILKYSDPTTNECKGVVSFPKSDYTNNFLHNAQTTHTKSGYVKLGEVRIDLYLLKWIKYPDELDRTVSSITITSNSSTTVFSSFSDLMNTTYEPNFTLHLQHLANYGKKNVHYVDALEVEEVVAYTDKHIIFKGFYMGRESIWEGHIMLYGGESDLIHCVFQYDREKWDIKKKGTGIDIDGGGIPQ